MVHTRNKLLIVDGYNVLRSSSRYRSIRSLDYTHDTFNRAREALFADVLAFGGSYSSIVIVFDGGNNEFSTGKEERIGGLRIIFSAQGSSADKVIEKLAWDARMKGIETLVISSDANIQDTVFGFGVDRMSSEGFAREMELQPSATFVEERQVYTRKNTLGERLKGDSFEKLKALRDSLGG